MLKENPVRKQRGFMEKIARHESSTLLRESRSRDFQRLLLKRGANVSNLREVSASFSIPFGKEPFDFIKEIAEIREKLGRPVRILSIGEGKSTFLSELIEHFGNKIEAHAVDVIRKNYAEGINGYVAHAEKLPARVHLDQPKGPRKESDMKKLPSTTGYFDVVVAHFSTDYAIDKIKALEEIHGVTALGGRAYIAPHPGISTAHFPTSWPWLFFKTNRWVKRKGLKRIPNFFWNMILKTVRKKLKPRTLRPWFKNRLGL